MKVGVQFHPQHTDIDTLRNAWQQADEMGLDSIWAWDHFCPLYRPPDGAHFEGWSLLAVMAVTTKNTPFGMLVTCNSYRNPDLLADIARTVDQLSGGRLYLGIGSGWFERDYEEYGYEFGTAPGRLKDLEAALPRIKSRLAERNPGPAGDLPILIGGGGEKVTLRLVAEHADAWNSFGPPEHFAEKNAVLDRWCDELGRDRAAVERTCAINPGDVDQWEAFVEAGGQHPIVRPGDPVAL